MNRSENRVTSNTRGIGVRAAVHVIQLYQNTVSPLRLPTCRFTPTCSQYAVDALTEFGLMHGSWLAAARLAKCGPWSRGGWDPVPERPTSCSTRNVASDGRNESHV
jgi:putative membrane protein insertion efficiency factor